MARHVETAHHAQLDFSHVLGRGSEVLVVMEWSHDPAAAALCSLVEVEDDERG